MKPHIILNTNTAIMQKLMRTVRKLEAEWRKVLWESMSEGAKEDRSINGRDWAAGFKHVTAYSPLKGILKLMKHLFT
jgi:hypothetical protein